jgi:hypothetical protein
MTIRRLAPLALVLGSLALGGCKQDIGERCQQGSDCSSGYCNMSSGSFFGNMDLVCTGPPGLTPVTVDAGGGEDASDAGDAVFYDAAKAGDAASSGDAVEAGDAASSEAGATDATSAETGDGASDGQSDTGG